MPPLTLRNRSLLLSMAGLLALVGTSFLWSYFVEIPSMAPVYVAAGAFELAALLAGIWWLRPGGKAAAATPWLLLVLGATAGLVDFVSIFRHAAPEQGPHRLLVDGGQLVHEPGLPGVPIRSLSVDNLRLTTVLPVYGEPGDLDPEEATLILAGDQRTLALPMPSTECAEWTERKLKSLI